MDLSVTEEVRGSGANRFLKVEKRRTAFVVDIDDIHRASDHVYYEENKTRHG